MASNRRPAKKFVSSGSYENASRTAGSKKAAPKKAAKKSKGIIEQLRKPISKAVRATFPTMKMPTKAEIAAKEKKQKEMINTTINKYIKSVLRKKITVNEKSWVNLVEIYCNIHHHLGKTPGYLYNIVAKQKLDLAFTTAGKEYNPTVLWLGIYQFIKGNKK